MSGRSHEHSGDLGNAVAKIVFDAVRRHGSAVAFRERGRDVTFSQAGERLARLANVLRDVSTDTGRCVAILMPNRSEYAEADLAIAVAGKVRAPITTRLADEERAYCLANVAAETLITEASELQRVAALLPQLPALRRVLVLDAAADVALPDIAIGYESALALASPHPPHVGVGEEDAAVVRHTSGTTGRAKGATISVRARLAAMRHSLASEYAAASDDCMLHVAPLGHASGDKVLTFFAQGAVNAFVPAFDAERFPADVATLGVTTTFMVPTMLRMLLAVPDSAVQLRNLTYGGSPIDADTRSQAAAHFGPVLTQIYGTTETPHPVLALDHAAHSLAETREATGRVVPGIQARIVTDDGADVTLGEPGELWVRGPNVMTGYWNDPGATAEVLVDGWYHTGDVAQELPGGWVAVVDRKKDLVITGGLNVYPAEVEAALLRHPQVMEAAVFRKADPLWGEIVAAAIVPAPGIAPSVADLTAHCEQLLAAYKKPRHFAFVDALPKGPTGKILKRLLAD